VTTSPDLSRHSSCWGEVGVSPNGSSGVGRRQSDRNPEQRCLLMGRLEALLQDVEALQSIFLERATQRLPEGNEYQAIRRRVLADPVARDRVPQFVRNCRSIDQFWPYIRDIDGTYAGRREHIWGEFRPLLDYLEVETRLPGDASIGETLENLDPAEITAIWQRALERRATDPEGAITSARTLVESVCKIILGEAGIPYSASVDLPKLYHLTVAELNLAPAQHDEDVFKRILGGANAVVNGLATVRNRYGDAHGKGRNPVKPDARHAELAVTLAGAMAAFLAATWRERKRETSLRLSYPLPGKT
jgi:hypothetical protein